jgi:hypothetical protein
MFPFQGRIIECRQTYEALLNLRASTRSSYTSHLTVERGPCGPLTRFSVPIMTELSGIGKTRFAKVGAIRHAQTIAADITKSKVERDFLNEPDTDNVHLQLSNCSSTH